MEAAVLLQQPTVAKAEVLSVEWLFEPAWPGRRLMARIAAGEALMTNGRGLDAADDEAAEAAMIIAAGLTADALVDVVSSPLIASPDGPGVAMMDVVELDRESLTSVPFAERRRLLESIVTPGERLRIGPVVKHPVGRWLDGWAASGFTHYLATHQNARYTPGATNPDQLEIAIGPPPAPGMVARLVGTRQRVRRVRD